MATDLTTPDEVTLDERFEAHEYNSAVTVIDQSDISTSDNELVTKDNKDQISNAPGGDRFAAGIDWPVAAWIGFLHLGALAAPFFFSWQGLILALVLAWITGGLGICLGYHRLFSHASFNTYRPVRWLIGLMGVLAGEGPVIQWVAVHRKHHAKSDDDEDPHSPRHGFWWSHAQWFLPRMSHDDVRALHQRYAPDLLRDPVLRLFEKTFLLWHWALGFGLFALGYFVWDVSIAWSLVVYGIFVRLVFVLHSTWFVNSATHVWGYRNYETHDDSRNLWWVALVTFGEGWHNNHHAYPRLAASGHKWWEFDITWQAIRALRATGLVWDVVDYRNVAEKKAKEAARAA